MAQRCRATAVSVTQILNVRQVRWARMALREKQQQQQQQHQQPQQQQRALPSPVPSPRPQAASPALVTGEDRTVQKLLNDLQASDTIKPQLREAIMSALSKQAPR